MSEEEVEHAVLSYLNKEPEDRRFQSLTTLFEMAVKPTDPNTDAFEPDEDIDTKMELQGLLNAMVQDGLLESHWGERDYEASYRLTDEGAYEASGFNQYVEAPLDAITTEDGEPLVTEDGDFIVSEENAEEEAPAGLATIDSSAWTGLTKVIIDARNAKVVSGLIERAIAALPESRAGNFEIMQATAYLRAAKELVDAPEPPSQEIWGLISRAADLVGLLGFFFTLFVQAAS